MNIGIIVYSQTGNTLSVATKLQEKLKSTGHHAGLERIVAVDPLQKSVDSIRFPSLPSLSGYDALVFAAPVQAFSLNPVMKAYLSRLEPLNNRKIACFVTMQFPAAWMGGNQAIGIIKDSLQKNHGAVSGTGVICWSNKKRDQIIDELVDRFAKLFS
jgi:NAD(P)H dehydrogenase (quinone)